MNMNRLADASDEIMTPYLASIRWPCDYCGAGIGEWCVTRRSRVRTEVMHARRGKVLREIMRREFHRGQIVGERRGRVAEQADQAAERAAGSGD